MILGEISPNLLSHGNWKSIKFSKGDGRPFGWDPSQEVHSDTFNHFHSLSWVRPSLSLMIQTSRPYSFLYVLIQSPNSVLSKWHNFTMDNLELWNFSHRKKNVHLRNTSEWKACKYQMVTIFWLAWRSIQKKFKFQNNFLKRFLGQGKGNMWNT